VKGNRLLLATANVKVTLEKAMNAQRWSRVIALLFP